MFRTGIFDSKEKNFWCGNDILILLSECKRIEVASMLVCAKQSYGKGQRERESEWEWVWERKCTWNTVIVEFTLMLCTEQFDVVLFNKIVSRACYKSHHMLLSSGTQ